MTTRILLADALSVLAPLVLAVLGWAVARVSAQIRARVRNARLRDVLALTSRVAAAGVAAAYQTTVRDLKDPALPGTWSSTIGQAVKASVIADVRRSIPAALTTLERLGGGDVGTLLDRLVEASVLELKARGVDTSSLRPPPLPAAGERAVILPPAPTGRAGDERATLPEIPSLHPRTPPEAP